MENFRDTNPINIELPRNSVGRAIDLSFIDYRHLNLFENKSLYELLHYLENYYNFFEQDYSMKDL